MKQTFLLLTEEDYFDTLPVIKSIVNGIYKGGVTIEEIDIKKTIEDHSDGSPISAVYIKSEEQRVTVKKPPVGLRPRFVILEQREKEILEAIERYKKANKDIPVEWVEEINGITNELANIRSKQLYGKKA